MPGEENGRRPLRFLHIGDLHLTTAREANHRALRAIIAEANAHLAGRVDVAILPGDIAEDGDPAQFSLAAQAFAALSIPWRAIPGDHDFKPRSLTAFYENLEAKRLPFAETIRGVRCLYLDIVTAGSGGPDFRLGDDAMAWLRRECDAVAGQGQTGVAFMHAYPADFGAGGEAVASLLDASPIVLVDTGHTHYNEICHDGRTIYAATRSVGQIEEGEAGFALACVDDGAVSWRFKPIASSWPFVMVTSPADRRLAFKASHADKMPIRAATFGASPIRAAEYRLGDRDWHVMQPVGDGLFAAHDRISLPREPIELSVRVVAEDGGEDCDTIEIGGNHVERCSTGGDASSVGAWASRHLLGTQLGPSRNGRKW